jgi:hypothetical protein
MTEDMQAVPCVVANASKLVRTEGQARCFAENLTGDRITVKSLLLTQATLAGMGERTRYIADVAYVAAAVFALAGFAGLAHWSTNEEPAVAPTKPTRKARRRPAPA